MTGKERLESIFNYQKADKLSWTILADERSLKSLPASMAGFDSVDLCKHFNCDIFQWSGLGLGPEHFLENPVRVLPDVEIKEEKLSNGQLQRTYISPFGRLNEVYSGYHPVKHLMKNIDDVRCFRKMWESCDYKIIDESRKLSKIKDKIGDYGVLAKALNGSVIPILLEDMIGMVNFYYLMADFPEEMDELIKFMHEKDLKRFELACQESVDQLMLIENTSTTFISPQIYDRYNFYHVRDFCDIVHNHNKKAIIHMCGHIKGLLSNIQKTGLDGIHALTPPPVGDTCYEDALDIWGDDNVFLLTCMDPAAINQCSVDDIPNILNSIYNQRIRNARMVLSVFVDGIDIPIEKIEAISNWYDREEFSP